MTNFKFFNVKQFHWNLDPRIFISKASARKDFLAESLHWMASFNTFWTDNGFKVLLKKIATDGMGWLVNLSNIWMMDETLKYKDPRT